MGSSKSIQMLGLFKVIILVFQRGNSSIEMKKRHGESKSKFESYHLENISDTAINEDDVNTPIQLEKEADRMFSMGICHNVSVLNCKCSTNNDTIKLNCSNRSISHVPGNIPANTAELILSDNNIEYISTGAFQNLNRLKLLDLSGNKIVKFRDGAFTGLNQLERLYIQNNNFNLTPSAFNENIFLTLGSLRELNVKSKSCTPKEEFTYPDKALAKLSSLETLTIDGLNNISFGKGFRNLTSLRILDLSQTPKFTSISKEMFHNLKDSPIHRLLLNNCDINWIHSDAFKYLTKIDTIDYSHNTALEIKGVSRSLYSLQNSTIRKIVLQNVHKIATYTEITDDDFKYLKNTQLEEIYVDRNRILRCTIGALNNMPKSLKIISASWNAFETTIPQIISMSMLRNLTEVIFSHQAVHSQMNQKLPAGSAKNESLNAYIVRFPPKLWRIEFSDSYILVDQIPNATVVNASLKYADFSNNQIYRWVGPVYGFDELEYLDLSGNSCKYMSMDFFGYLPKLNTLKIANNHLGPELMETIFDNLTSLKTLDIHQNIQENTLPGLFIRLTNLVELDMSSNYLTSWRANLSGLTNLSRLNLSSNKFTSLPQTLRDNLDQIAKHNGIQVDLQDNRLQCVCGTIDFVAWFVQTQVEFLHLNSTTCRLDNDTDVSLTHKYYILKYLQSHCRSYTILISVTSGCFGVGLMVLIIYLVRRNRWRIRYKMYTLMNRNARSGYQRLEGDDEENPFFFDAFISYEDSSRSFIINEVIPRLEEEAKLKLCIDKRDFVPGLCVTDNIMNAIRNSKKTIVLLTREFLKSEWCMYELNMSRMEGVHTGRQLLTVVLLEDFPTTEYSRDVLDLFVRQTYIERVEDEYGAQLFWHKLISAIKGDNNMLNPSV